MAKVIAYLDTGLLLKISMRRKKWQSCKRCFLLKHVCNFLNATVKLKIYKVLYDAIFIEIY